MKQAVPIPIVILIILVTIAAVFGVYTFTSKPPSAAAVGTGGAMVPAGGAVSTGATEQPGGSQIPSPPAGGAKEPN